MARPTDYNDRVLEETLAYYHSFIKPKNSIDQKQPLSTERFNQIPYIEELSLELDIDDDTIVEWCKIHKEFSVTIKKIKTLQKIRLLNKTMDKNSTTGAIFQLKCNHGMIDKQVYEHRNEPGQTFGVSINAGAGFLPATVQLSTPSARSDAGRQPSVQSSSVAPSSPKDDYRNQ